MAGFNPLKLMKIKSAQEQFTRNHPKFSSFLQLAAKEGIHENTIIEITITTADGRSISSNMKVTASDMELLQSLRSEE